MGACGVSGFSSMWTKRQVKLLQTTSIHFIFLLPNTKNLSGLVKNITLTFHPSLFNALNLADMTLIYLGFSTFPKKSLILLWIRFSSSCLNIDVSRQCREIYSEINQYTMEVWALIRCANVTTYKLQPEGYILKWFPLRGSRRCEGFPP